MAEQKTTPKTISVGITESYSTWIVRESIELNIEDYPELEGMNGEEIQDYIQCNSGDMKSNDEYSDSLYHELIQKDVVRDKITNEDSEFYFD
jgi:hypothetical protein